MYKLIITIIEVSPSDFEVTAMTTSVVEFDLYIHAEEAFELARSAGYKVVRLYKVQK